MNAKIVARKIFFLGFLLGIGLFFIPQTQIWIVYAVSLFYPAQINKYVLLGVVGLFFGTLMDMSYMIYLKEGRWGLIRIAVIIGVLILLVLILSGGLLGSHVLYF